MWLGAAADPTGLYALIAAAVTAIGGLAVAWLRNRDKREPWEDRLDDHEERIQWLERLRMVRRHDDPDP